MIYYQSLRFRLCRVRGRARFGGAKPCIFRKGEKKEWLTKRRVETCTTCIGIPARMPQTEIVSTRIATRRHHKGVGRGGELEIFSLEGGKGERQLQEEPGMRRSQVKKTTLITE